MCGSGTLAIEAALIAADIAPGLLAAIRLRALARHDAAAWQALRDEPRKRAACRDCLTPGRFRGFDRDAVAIRDAERTPRAPGSRSGSSSSAASSRISRGAGARRGSSR